jgi:AraC-like DNA-binding protein
MHSKLLPLHNFEPKRHTDLAFEAGAIENMPDLAQASFPHRHNFYELFWIKNGFGQHSIDFIGYKVQANTLFFITPGQVHYWQIEKRVEGSVMLFTEDFLLLNRLDPMFMRNFDFYHSLVNPPVLYLNQPQVEQFDMICEHILQEYQTAQFGQATIIQSLLQILLVQAQRCYVSSFDTNKPKAGPTLVRNFLRLIDLDFQTKQNVEEYAHLLAVTPDYLSEVTKQTTGQTASTHIHQRVLLEAKRLLAHTDHNINEICDELGFKDPSYFSRFFKRKTGQPPLLFRKEFQEKYHKSPH